MIPFKTLKHRLRSPFDGFMSKKNEAKHEETRNHFQALGVWLDDHLEDGPAKDRMMDSLEEASLWAHHAIFDN